MGGESKEDDQRAITEKENSIWHDQRHDEG